MSALFGLSITLLIVVAVFVFAISVVYSWIIPTFFGGYKTHIFFVVGTILAAMLGSYFTFQNLAIDIGTGPKLVVAFVCGVVVAILVLFLSLLVTVNIMGS